MACSDGTLRSDYIRKSSYKSQFNYVAPVEVELGRNDSNERRTFQYIPVKKTLKSLFQNKSVQQEYQATKSPTYHGYGRNDEERLLHDVTDGSIFKTSVFFQENSNVLKLILYQDSFEVCNPLGSSKKKKAQNISSLHDIGQL